MLVNKITTLNNTTRNFKNNLVKDTTSFGIEVPKKLPKPKKNLKDFANEILTGDLYKDVLNGDAEKKVKDDIHDILSDS